MIISISNYRSHTEDINKEDIIKEVVKRRDYKEEEIEVISQGHHIGILRCLTGIGEVSYRYR